MSNALFPQLPGLHWEVQISDEFSTLVQPSAAPGFETRLSLGPDPIFHFDCSFNFLRQPGAQGYSGADELQVLRGFYRARGADFDSFLLSLPQLTENPADGSVAGQLLTPDSNNVAALVVTGAGGFAENIYEAAGVNGDPGTAPVIKRDGATLTFGTDYVFAGPGYASSGVTYPGLVVVFLSSTTGHTMTAVFAWYYRVRFEQNKQQFNKFLALLYSAQKVQLVTTRTGNSTGVGDVVAINSSVIPSDAGDVVTMAGSGIPYSPGDTIAINGS